MQLLAPVATLALAATVGGIGAAQSVSIERGALVLVKDSQNRLVVTSVVAIAGDVVSISDGRVSVNGLTTTVSVSGVTRFGPRQVTEGQYFVAGDPLQLAIGTNAWGMIDASAIVGTVQPIKR